MIEVDQRQLGASGITVPALGVGIWSWGDTGFWGYGRAYTYEDVTQAYKTCLEDGLNFFDTAEIYGSGESERILGQCYRQDGRQIIIASKFAPLPNRFNARTLLSALDASLERLGVDHIDLYQIHWPYTFLDINALMDALALAVHSGKVRAVGVSNFNEFQMRKAYARLALHDVPLASNQVHYSLLHRQPEANGVLDTCRELNVALIAYSPLEQGLLTGKYRVSSADAVKLEGTRRLTRAFSQGQRRKMEPLLQTMQSIANAHDKTLGQVALNWLLAKDPCVIPIPGAKNVRQATQNAGALGWRLTDTEISGIELASRPWLPNTNRSLASTR
jgi:aryl-alcohol dehydrogenase-like predicted oxidoreductase